MNDGSLIARVKSALPLRVYLAEHGAEFVRDKSPCLFHEDRTPSASLYRGKDGFERLKCFGCGKDVDLIGAAQELHGLDTRAAIKLLADRAGLSMQTPADIRAAEKARRERERKAALVERFRAWERKKVDSMSALLRLYRQKAAQGFTEEEIKVFAPLIHAIPEIEHSYEEIFCTRRRALFEEEYHNAGR